MKIDTILDDWEPPEVRAGLFCWKERFILLLVELKLCLHHWNETVFCLGEKQGVLVNDECSFWFNRVGDFLLEIYRR